MITANASTAADDLGVAASGDAAIERALDNDASIVAAPRVISPTGIPGGAAEQPLNDLSPSLFNNDAADNIPSQHLCPITQEPPFDAVHFNVPTADGATIPNQQVYKRSALYRYIATPGTSVREGISFIPSPVHLLHRIEHGTLSVLLSPLCRRLFTMSDLLLASLRG
jgi:hypothetical protein